MYVLAGIREEMEFDYSITNELLSAMYVFQEAVSSTSVITVNILSVIIIVVVIITAGTQKSAYLCHIPH